MATIKDIADAVGVSIGTVDRIIHKRGRYSEKTAEKVRQAMKDLNYTPNIHARGLKKTKTHRFAAVIPFEEQDNGYWRLLADGIRRASGELGSYGCLVDVIPFDRYDEASCEQAMAKAMDAGEDGLLIAAALPGRMKPYLEEGTVPYLFVDSDIPDLDGRLSYIGQDSFQSGILSGKLMALLLAGADKRGGVLMIEPPGSNAHLRERMRGFRSYMEANVPALPLMVMKEEQDEEEHFHKRLNEYVDGLDYMPDGIFVANSSVYYAASWLASDGSAVADLPLIGYDLIPGREHFIEDGVIDFILTQQPETQGYEGIMNLYNHLVLNREIQKEVIIPLNIITKENLRTFDL